MFGLSLASILAFYAYRTGKWKHYIACGVVVLDSNITTQLLKHHMVHRPPLVRTSFYVEKFYLEPNTLPSGHTTLAVYFVMAVFIMMPSRYRNSVSFFGVFAALLMALTLYVGMFHRMSDIIAAYMVVGFWTVCTLIVLFKLGLEKEKNPRWKPYWDIISLFCMALSSAICLFLSIIIKLSSQNFYNSPSYNLLVALDAIFAIVFISFFMHFLIMTALRALLTGRIMPSQA